MTVSTLNFVLFHKLPNNFENFDKQKTNSAENFMTLLWSQSDFL